jgi:3-oxoacyl-[acyl-carrier protein] reductase
LENRTAVVTGGAQGIGRAIGLLFAEHGAGVVIGDINDELASGVAEEIRERGGRAIAVSTDVSAEADMQRLIQVAIAEFGTVDIMVNNAGVPRNSPLTEMSVATFDEVVAVHLRGAWLGTREAAKVMVANGGGAIINMSSISGKIGRPGQSNYSAAKAGMVGLTKATANELGQHNVRVNAIQPGTIRTERTALYDPKQWASWIAEVPLGREGRPEELAAVALFLASDLASYVSGAVVEVTGGRYL